MNALILELERVKERLEEQRQIAEDESHNKIDDWESGYAVGNESAFKTSIEELDEVLVFAAKLYPNT